MNMGAYGPDGHRDESQSLIRRGILDTDRAISYENSTGGTPEFARVSNQRESMRGYVRSQLQGGQAAKGYFAQDGKSVVEILRSSPDLSILRTDEVVDNMQCVVIQGTSGYGSYTLWLDPNAGYLPRRVLVTKQKDHFWSEVKIADRSPFSNGKLKDVAYRLDSVEIEEVDGQHVITSFVATENSGLYKRRDHYE